MPIMWESEMAAVSALSKFLLFLMKFSRFSEPSSSSASRRILILMGSWCVVLNIDSMALKWVKNWALSSADPRA